MTEKLVTIAIASYNNSQYIERCIDSVINQTYKNLEVLIVDDGSTDETPIIIDRIAAEDNRVVVVHQVNAGPGVARNAGINLARGDYLLFLDSDDMIDCDFISKMYEAASTGNYDMITSPIIMNNK